MRVVDIPQHFDDGTVNDDWLNMRETLVTGTKFKDVKPLSRTSSDTGEKIGVGFYDLLANRFGTSIDAQDPAERGLSLENENAKLVVKKFGLENPNYDAGVWLGDDEFSMFSTDVSEGGDNPTWLIESKCFDSKKHILLLYKLLKLKESGVPASEWYQIIPKDNIDQVIHAFWINPNLQDVYWTNYDPRFANEALRHFVVQVKRSDVADLIEKHNQIMLDTAELINNRKVEITNLLEKFGAVEKR